MAVNFKMQRNQELRKVPEGYLDPITATLDINEDWKRVMALIPKDPKDLHSARYVPKYNCEHVRLIEQHARTTNLRCAKVLFDEWGTSGRVRPTVQTLMELLQKAQIIRAADELAILLNEEPIPRPGYGPGAEIDLDISSYMNNTSALQPPVNGTNGTFGSVHARPTRPMTSGGPSSYPDFEAMGVRSTAQMESNQQPPPPADNSSMFRPAFTELLGQTNTREINTNSTISAASTSNSETSESASEDNNQTQGNNTVYTDFVIPESSMIDRVDSEILEDKTLINFKYAELEALTGKFSNSHIGSGGFGDVFIGIHETYGVLAIKRAHVMLMSIPSIDFVKIFNTEVKSLMILRHENIVPILGYCLDGVAPCIVCKYIEGGSLLDNIAEKRLNEAQIMNILQGTAEGLKYIHNTVKPSSMSSNISSVRTSKKAYFLHGDVKSANILITKEFVPKLCDFGLSRECITTNHQTETMMGTRAYMAPERFHGTITQKGDVFSFGIVMLELLTGLQPIIDDNVDKLNIKEYVEENGIGDDITHLLDPAIKNKARGQKLYEVAQLCLIDDKIKRPTINVICDHLHRIINF